tara:strand:+ start:3200 stop:3796 length:597 start_codon:yes stop_codon:yes gene_type:complete
MTKQKLQAFTNEIKDLFDAGKIRSPAHLSRGNEEKLIKIFKEVKKKDWVFSTHRSHYHALLKGIPSQWLKNEILENRSIHISNKEYKFFSSAIVGGVCPIALGTALALKWKGWRNKDSKVWCFIGDMAAETGIFYECTKYASRNELPITFVIEDNYLSVNTPTQESWGLGKFDINEIVKYYEYIRVLPHAGGGKWIAF